jgi:hypothetical protein
MSPKELLYIEDALGHEQQCKTFCTDFSAQISDTQLKSFVGTMATKHQKNFDKFYQLLNG